MFADSANEENDLYLETDDKASEVATFRTAQGFELYERRRQKTVRFHYAFG